MATAADHRSCVGYPSFERLLVHIATLADDSGEPRSITYRRKMASPAEWPPLTLSVRSSSPATAAVRHFQGDATDRSGRTFGDVPNSPGRCEGSGRLEAATVVTVLPWERNPLGRGS